MKFSIIDILHWTLGAAIIAFLLRRMGADQPGFWNECCIAFWYFFISIDELNKLMSTGCKHGSAVIGVIAAYLSLCLTVLGGTILIAKKLKVLS